MLPHIAILKIFKIHEITSILHVSLILLFSIFFRPWNDSWRRAMEVPLMARAHFVVVEHSPVIIQGSNRWLSWLLFWILRLCLLSWNEFLSLFFFLLLCFFLFLRAFLRLNRMDWTWDIMLSLVDLRWDKFFVLKVHHFNSSHVIILMMWIIMMPVIWHTVLRLMMTMIMPIVVGVWFKVMRWHVMTRMTMMFVAGQILRTMVIVFHWREIHVWVSIPTISSIFVGNGARWKIVLSCT